jgi:hypothetical protein
LSSSSVCVLGCYMYIVHSAATAAAITGGRRCMKQTATLVQRLPATAAAVTAVAGTICRRQCPCCCGCCIPAIHASQVNTICCSPYLNADNQLKWVASIHSSNSLQAHLGTMLAGTSQRLPSVGYTLMCRRVGVSGVASTVRRSKLAPYSGAASLLSLRRDTVAPAGTA